MVSRYFGREYYEGAWSASVDAFRGAAIVNQTEGACDTQWVTAYDLRTGRRLVFAAADAGPGPPENYPLPTTNTCVLDLWHRAAPQLGRPALWSAVLQ